MAVRWDELPPAELEREYSPSSRVPALAAELERYARESALARTCLPWWDLGDADFFPAGPGSPLLVFVHGGYWQQLGKSDASFPALGLVPRGISYAAIGYGLAPAHRMDEIVSMVRRSTARLCSRAGSLGCSPEAVVLAGSSAGAHLAAMSLITGGLPLRGGVLLSGVYDLEPLLRTGVNDAIGMDQDEAARNSPIRHLPARLPPLVLALGEHETTEFTRQHRDFHRALRGNQVTELRARGRNHFDICFDLADPTTALGAAVTTLLR
ncbi:alpha/beta hydrolase [Actinokineospora sp. 24-640]